MISMNVSRFFLSFAIALSALSLQAAQESKKQLEIATTSADQKRDIHVTCAMSGGTIEYPRAQSHYDSLIQAFDTYQRVTINHGAILSKGVLSYLIRKSQGLISKPTTPKDMERLQLALNFYANNLGKSVKIKSHDDSIKSEFKKRSKKKKGTTKASFICPACNKVTKSPEYRVTHYVNTHMDKKKSFCYMCETKITEINCRKHVLFTHKINEKL